MEGKKIQKFESEILKINQITDSVKHITISTPDEFEFYPGQFISLLIKNGEKDVRRPYSIASKPSKKTLELCIKIIPGGEFTPLINNLNEGDKINILGPMGDFIIKDDSKPLTFISTGTGISPFRSMINHLLHGGNKNQLTLITGYRYEKNILYESEFKELESKHPNFSYHRILSRDGDETGYVQDLITQNLNPESNYYICGLKEMVLGTKELLIEKGIPKENIFIERYS